MSDLVANMRARFAPLLTEAEGALHRREKQYPVLVAAGRMSEQASIDEIRTWRAIVSDWRNVVTGQGPKGSEASIAEKVAVLTETLARYNIALATEIRRSSGAVRRDCVEGANLARLSTHHGDEVAAILDMHNRRERIEDMRDFYREELPGHTGLFSGIDDYLDFHQRLRSAHQQQIAA